MAYIQERLRNDGKMRYRVQIRLKGFPLVTATFERKTDAKKWAQKTEVAMREKRYFKESEAEKHTVSDLIDRYLEDIIPQKPKSGQATAFHLRWWKKQLGYCLLCDLTPSLIAEQKDRLLKETTCRKTKRSPATVNRYLASLSHALTLGVKEWGWLRDSPMQRMSRPKESRGRDRFLNEPEKEALLDACQKSSHPYLYLIVVLALSTGMRRNEIVSLRWENVDLTLQRIHLDDTKNGEKRSVPLRGTAFELIKAFKRSKKRDFGLLFPSYRHLDKPANIRKPWEKALKKAAIENFRFHDLRHSAARFFSHERSDSFRTCRSAWTQNLTDGEKICPYFSEALRTCC